MTRTLTEKNISVTIHDSFESGTVMTIKDSSDEQEMYLYLHEIELVAKLARELSVHFLEKPPVDEL